MKRTKPEGAVLILVLLELSLWEAYHIGDIVIE